MTGFFMIVLRQDDESTSTCGQRANEGKACGTNEQHHALFIHVALCVMKFVSCMYALLFIIYVRVMYVICMHYVVLLCMYASCMYYVCMHACMYVLCVYVCALYLSVCVCMLRMRACLSACTATATAITTIIKFKAYQAEPNSKRHNNQIQV